MDPFNPLSPRPFRFPALTLGTLFLLLTSLGCATERKGTQSSQKAGTANSTGQNLGIDVSHFSGTVDWSAVQAAGYAFAYVKATEGMDSKDPLFDRHWRDLEKTGLPRGAYHFYVTEDDPDAQAAFFIETVHFLPGDLPPVVDIESLGHATQPGLAQRLRRWLELVEAAFGVKPILYTSPNFWQQHLPDTFGNFRLWIAEYEVDEPKLPHGWDAWSIWQFAADASVLGVEKGADLSRLAPGLITTDLATPAKLQTADSPPTGR